MKKFNEMSNQDIMIEQKVLENEFEAVKAKISGLYDRMDELDRKYTALENELERRNG